MKKTGVLVVCIVLMPSYSRQIDQSLMYIIALRRRKGIITRPVRCNLCIFLPLDHPLYGVVS